MKKLSILGLLLILLASCSKDYEIPNIPQEDDGNKLELRSATYYYCLPISRYYSDENREHYFGGLRPDVETYGATVTIKGKVYRFEYRDFKTLFHYQQGTVPLKRFYRVDGSKIRHKLGTENTLSGWTAENEFLGYIYSSQIPGSVSIKEYYSPDDGDFHYVSLAREETWLQRYTPNVYYVRTIGYAFLDERTESGSNPYLTIDVLASRFTTAKKLKVFITENDDKAELYLRSRMAANVSDGTIFLYDSAGNQVGRDYPDNTLLKNMGIRPGMTLKCDFLW